jgi:RNA-directed DNA polymerase
MHENRESSWMSWLAQQDRSAKAINRTADVNVQEQSDCAVVPMNQPNKEGQPSAEVGEGRAQTEENIVPPNMRPTQSGNRMSQGLNGVRQVAREREQERFPMTRDRVVPIMRASVSWLTLGVIART